MTGEAQAVSETSNIPDSALDRDMAGAVSRDNRTPRIYVKSHV